MLRKGGRRIVSSGDRPFIEAIVDRCIGWSPFANMEGELAKKRSDGRYIYGPCPHLGDEDGKASCGLRETDRHPIVCAIYPVIGANGQRYTHPNPGTFVGCGYNADPKAGLTMDQMLTVKPLWKKER